MTNFLIKISFQKLVNIFRKLRNGRISLCLMETTFIVEINIQGKIEIIEQLDGNCI